LDQNLAQLDSDLEGKIDVLKEFIPILSDLQTDAQRSLYIHRLSERIGIKEEIVWSELKAFRKNSSESSVGRDLRQRLAASQAEKRLSDSQLLNLLIHYPQAALRLMECEWKMLLSDPAVVEIVETFFQKYRQGDQCSAEDLAQGLESETARKQLREAMLEASYYSDQMIEQALTEFEDKVHQATMSASIKRAKKRGDIEELNQLLKLKAQRVLRR